MAEGAFKDRLAESCYMKLQAILPLINSITKSSVSEVVFSYWFQEYCSDTKFKTKNNKPNQTTKNKNIQVLFTFKDKMLCNLWD